MKPCKRCSLAFSSLDQNGHCAECAAAVSAAAPQSGTDEIARMRADLERQNQQIADLNQRLARPAAAPPADAEAQIKRQAWENPVGTMQAVAQHTFNQLAAQDHETMRLTAKKAARDQDPEMAHLFDKYADEIEQAVNTMHPSFHRNVNVWATAFENVRGRHIRELIAAEREKQQETKPATPAIRIPGSNGPAAPSPRQAPSTERRTELSDEAKTVARKLRLSEDRMAQAIKDFENQGDATDPTVASSWDRVMSFDRNTGQAAKRREARRKAVA